MAGSRINEGTLETNAKRMKAIKQAASNINKKRAEKLAKRKADLEYQRDLKRLENGE